MISKQEAVAASYRQEFHHGTRRNADNTPMRVRVNGACKTWKTRPLEFRLPVKHGMYDSGYITHENAAEWFLTDTDAISSGMDSALDSVCGDGTAKRMRESLSGK